MTDGSKFCAKLVRLYVGSLARWCVNKTQLIQGITGNDAVFHI